MSKQRFWVAMAIAVLVMTGGGAQATLYTYNFGSGATVADGNPTGMADSRTINDIAGSDEIVNVTVRLNLSGGYNGDLYGYLVLTDAGTHVPLGFSTLLNRVGTGAGSQPQFSFGYSDSVLNVALSDTGAHGNIHNYQDVGSYASLINSGGAFQTDGGNLGDFSGAGANNTWTLFLADLSSGETMTVNSWGLDIEVVPEPVTYTMILFGAGLVGVEVRRRLKLSKEAGR